MLYSRVLNSRDTGARGKCTVSPCGLAHCRKSTANAPVVLLDINKPGIIIVPDNVHPKKIFSQTICKNINY